MTNVDHVALDCGRVGLVK